MSKAIWRDCIIANSDDVALVKGNAYFSIAPAKVDYLSESATTLPTYFHWKGIAHFYDFSVDEDDNAGAAWTYGEPYTASRVITGRIAFCNGFEVLCAPAGVALVELLPSPRDGRTGWEAPRHGDQDANPEAEITANTDLSPVQLPAAWAHNDM